MENVDLVGKSLRWSVRSSVSFPFLVGAEKTRRSKSAAYPTSDQLKINIEGGPGSLQREEFIFSHIFYASTMT
jgi:hypothetical protein